MQPLRTFQEEYTRIQKKEESSPRNQINQDFSKVPLACEEEEDNYKVIKAHRDILSVGSSQTRQQAPFNNMDTIVNIVGGNPGGRAKYFLNDETTIQKLKAAAEKSSMNVTHNSGSKTIEFSTGAYVSVVLPLIKMWQDIKGHPIHPEEVDGMDISVVTIEIERDLGGTILQYMVELKVQGRKVKVTCYDTSLTMLVQSGKMLEDYCARVLLPYLSAEINVLGRVIDEKNCQVRAYGEPRKTRQQQKESVKGAAILEPHSTPRVLKAASILEPPYTSRTPRLLSYSSPVPKILPLTLLLPGQEEVEALHPPVRQVLALPPTPRTVPQKDMQKDLEPESLPSPLNIQAPKRLALVRQPLVLERQPQDSSSPAGSSRTLPAEIEYVPDAELEARHGLFQAIVTSRSQTVPDKFMRTINLDNIDTEELSSLEDDEEDDIIQNNVENDFKCTKCKNGCVETGNLLEHREKTQAVSVCSVCRENFIDVMKLQEHILTKHCMKPDVLTEALKVHMQLLNTLLTNQVAMQQNLGNMALKQLCMATNISEVQEAQRSAVMTRPAYFPTNPSTPVVTPTAPPEPPSQMTYAGMTRPVAPLQPPQAPQGQTRSPQQARTQGQKILWVGDSIAHHVDFEDLEKATKTKIRRKKAYGAVRASGQKFPESNFTEVVPRELSEQQADILVLQASSVDLTNIPADASNEYSKQVALVSSQNMVAVAKNALAANNGVKHVLLLETTPRYDNKNELNMFAQMKLREAKDEAKDDRIIIGKHSLACTDGLRVSRYGAPGKPRVDGVHLRGSSGMVAYTRSVAKVMAAVGLISEQEAAEMSRNKDIKFNKENGGWNQNKAKKGRAPRPAQQMSAAFELATHNRFGPLQFQGNC